MNRITLEDLQEICLALPGVTTDIKWEEHLCFNIGAKMFLATSPDRVPVSASFKTTPEEFEVLTGREGIHPASHVGRYHWVHVDSLDRLTKAEWEAHIHESFRLVASKLSGKLRKELGIGF
ncbi:MmcQ/YjbR family DNA-binding protein [Siphonobacter aquaeclarae]|jgi:predicted DNA-binding protein (MmcQ/YjbR family)|uniref:Predicted DNA-binding protein, MmcQ/YjbR family n=1 Tax=Siphonobacter aquaeclarae TaxID=563176 RepID=A0A1G9V2X0_9BACT|nr:MmcQ/YjbR family DNA-binding protein [Siphonobacter aquaeclarae]SDM66602.1 Predicted DNA-binding protein, MmcQ/YjbR family [Siphonobacter aquaeclarae]